MDILQKYNEAHPQAVPKVFQSESLEEVGFFIRLVIRLSGGRIQDVTHANYVLIGLVCIVILISLFLIFGGSNENTLPPKIMDDNFNQTTRGF